jgi:hypothetical protein
MFKLASPKQNRNPEHRQFWVETHLPDLYLAAPNYFTKPGRDEPWAMVKSMWRNRSHSGAICDAQGAGWWLHGTYSPRCAACNQPIMTGDGWNATHKKGDDSRNVLRSNARAKESNATAIRAIGQQVLLLSFYSFLVCVLICRSWDDCGGHVNRDDSPSHDYQL